MAVAVLFHVSESKGSYKEMSVENVGAGVMTI
jgi:hypothetical protein